MWKRLKHYGVEKVSCRKCMLSFKQINKNTQSKAIHLLWIYMYSFEKGDGKLNHKHTALETSQQQLSRLELKEAVK